MKYVADGAKTMAIHSDPSDRSNDSLKHITSGSEIDILDGKVFYGTNNKEYVYVKANGLDEGYLLKGLIRKKVACG